MTALRWAAAALALVAVVDPAVPLPHRARPALRLAGGDGEALAARLRVEGFAVDGGEAAATIVTSDARIDAQQLRGRVYLLSHGPAVTMTSVSVPATRVADQAMVVSTALRGTGVRGQTTTLYLEDGRVPVATTTHRWTTDDESWDTAVSYLPGRGDAFLLRLRATTSGTPPAVADVLAPPLRGPIRTLVYDTAVTWASIFVRRALEDEPAFSVASAQRATPSAITRAGTPPPALTRAELAPYELLVCGRLDGITPAAIETIRWFVEERGGVVALVVDRLAGGPASSLVPGMTFESRVLAAPVALRGVGDGLSASELAIPRGLGPSASPLASDPGGTPIVVALRRGMGAIVVSGALDAWRYRERDAGAFARFWAAALLTQASTVPPPLEVQARPSVVQPGNAVQVRARLRGTELPGGDRVELPPIEAHIVDPVSGARDTPLRLWPTPEPGVYEGEWKAAGTGRYVVDVMMGDARAGAIVAVESAAASPSDEAPLRAAAGSGGVFSSETALVTALTTRFPATWRSEPVRPSRSPWWAAAFAACLCAEWTARRRRGLA